MDEKYTVELVSPVPPDKFDDTVERVAAVIKKDTAAVTKLLGRGPGKLTKGTSKQKADAFANRLQQAGLDVVVLGEGEKRPPPRPAAAVEAKLTDEDTAPPPAQDAFADSAPARGTSNDASENDFAASAGGASAFDDDFGTPTSSAFEEDFDDSAASNDPFAEDDFEQQAGAGGFSNDNFSDEDFGNDNFSNDNFGNSSFSEDNFSDDDFDTPPAARQNLDDDFGNEEFGNDNFDDDFSSPPAETSAETAETSDGFDDDFDRDAFDDDGFGTAIRERVPAASQESKGDKDAKDAKGKKGRDKKEKPAKKSRKAKAAKDGEKKGSNPALVVLLVLLLLVLGSAAALILLPEEYTAFVPDSVRTSVAEAPEAISSFFVSIPGRVSALWGGEPTTPVTDTTDTPTDTADTTTDATTDVTPDTTTDAGSEGDGGEIIAVPSFEEDTDTATADAVTATTTDATDTPAVPEDSGDAIVEVTPERIFTAASSGTAEEINALAQAGADFNIRDDFGQAPLIYALNNSQAVVQALINQGANVNAQTDAGWTPLMYAARDAGGNIISVLLQAGADTSITNNDGQTAVDIAQATPDREGATQIILDSQ